MSYQYRTLFMACFAAITLSACASMSAVEAGAPFKAETSFKVTPSTAWTRLPDDLNPTKGSALTQDGVPLGAVYLVTVENEKAMIDKIKRKNLPRYTSGSTVLEQIDFLESSLALIGYVDVKTADVRPATVEGQSGIQFGFNGKYPNGLDLRGEVLMFETGDELNIIFYTAPKMHYYDKYKGYADAIFKSVSLN